MMKDIIKYYNKRYQKTPFKLDSKCYHEILAKPGTHTVSKINKRITSETKYQK